MTRSLLCRSPQGLSARSLVMLLALGCAGAAAQEQGAQDEPIASGRPDFVESSEGIGKGRVQLETGLLSERARGDAGREHTLSTPTTLRVGVSETLELRVESDGRSVLHSRDAASGARTTQAGYADSTIGLLWHVADARGSLPSTGVLVDATLPTGSRLLRGEGVRPSLRVVGSWDLPGDMQLSVMPGLAVEHEDEGGRYTHGLFGIGLEKRFDARLRGVAELALPQIASSRHGGTQASAGIGLGWLLTHDCEIDTMFSRGLNHNTPYASFTVGLSIRR
ncbi:transporter [Massilia haematophila]|uniref:Transporter n=1 Tax=Massilia haematophila TaxID=457923 RepID=A0ABV7PD62_9BURK